MTPDKPLEAYRSANVDASVACASPHELILMLYRGARVALAHARGAIGRGDAPARGQAVSKAIAIIDDGLHASLDPAQGGDLAAQLHELYRYMVVELALANLREDAAALERVDQLLGELEAAWAEIGAKLAPAAAAPARPAHASVSYGKA